MATSLKVLVTGATGKQGGAVARRLRENNHHVRALTRTPDSPAAAELARLGVEMAQGDLTDRASLDRALQGMDSVFLMATPFEAGTGAETVQGVTMADAAKAAGTFLVYSSVGDADRNTGIPHFDSKYAVEKHIRAIGADATIIAPVYFMDNVVYIRDQLRNNVYPSALSPDRGVYQIAVSDVAAVAVTVLENKARYAGKRYDIGVEEVSPSQTVRILSEVTGRPFVHFQLPTEMVRQTMGEDGVKMNEYFEQVGYHVDRAELEREFPNVRWTSFETWARNFDWTTFLGT
ncbi:MAG TPA: NmrA/HSCARG family protein [Gemmatimonadaceae bacterium]|nr:NmrA/HSCARG family protein [Gemmatimonadaceae bacterium]